MSILDIVIIGAGPAGLFAYIAARKSKLKTIILESTNSIGGKLNFYQQKTIYDFPHYRNIKAKLLIKKINDNICNKSDIFFNTKVLSICKDKNKFNILSNKRKFVCKYVIIATGGGFFTFNRISNNKFNNIHYFVKDINCYKNKDLVIAGGGDSAIDWAIELCKNKIVNSLKIVHRRSEFRACKKKINILKKYNVKFYLNKDIKLLNKNKVELIDKISNNIEILNFDYLIVQYGLTYSLQDNKLLKHFKLNNSNQIIVDRNRQSSIKNIYAIGDVSFIHKKKKTIDWAYKDAKKAIANILKINYEKE